MPKRLFLIAIGCLGETRFEIRAHTDACAAIVATMDRYPQHCAISARLIAGA